MVSIMKMKACRVMIRMWNTAHAHCRTMPRPLSQSRPLPNITAIRMNDQLAGIHVAEQTQGQGDRLGDQGHEFQQEVHRDQQGLNEDVLAAERVQGQFADEAADALDLDAVENDQREYRQGHAQGSVRVSGRVRHGTGCAGRRKSAMAN